eukprot:2945245-Rhodomonas_salina.2
MCASCSRPANRFELVACHLCATPEQNVFSTVIHDVLTRTARFRAQFMLGVQGDAHINNSSVHLQWAQPALASQPIPSTPHPAATPLASAAAGGHAAAAGAEEEEAARQEAGSEEGEEGVGEREGWTGREGGE